MMMGSWKAAGVIFGVPGMLTPLIAIGAIIYLIAAKRKNPDQKEAR